MFLTLKQCLYCAFFVYFGHHFFLSFFLFFFEAGEYHFFNIFSAFSLLGFPLCIHWGEWYYPMGFWGSFFFTFFSLFFWLNDSCWSLFKFTSVFPFIVNLLLNPSSEFPPSFIVLSALEFPFGSSHSFNFFSVKIPYLFIHSYCVSVNRWVVSDSANPLGSSVHGVPQARRVNWVGIPFSRGSSCPGIRPGLLHCRQIFTIWDTKEALSQVVKTVFLFHLFRYFCLRVLWGFLLL